MDLGLSEIQYCDDSDATPLVLIHDGGGTIFNYYFLSDLDRPVFGIANPHFDTKEPWPSLDAMAGLYAGWIKDEIKAGPVILGGGCRSRFFRFDSDDFKDGQWVVCCPWQSRIFWSALPSRSGAL